LILGLAVFGGFLLWTLVSLILDGIQRNKDYLAEIKECEDILRSEFQKNDADLAAYRQEFDNNYANIHKVKKEDNTLIN